MPIYEYVCSVCGSETEKLQRLSDAPLSDCPSCGKPALVRKISAAGFRLKGAGWYETDFKQSGKKNLSGEASAPKEGKPADTKADSTSGAKTEGKSGSKPESKSESKASEKTAAPAKESGGKKSGPGNGSASAA